MTWLVVALSLSATCEHPALAMLPEDRQEAACELLAQPAPEKLEHSTLAPIYERPGFERARLRNTGALQALMAQLRNWFESLFESSGAEAYSNVTRVVVLVLALVIGGGVTLRLLNRRRAKVLAPERAGTVAAALVLDDPATHLLRAEALLGSAPREAIREALLSLLSSLERKRFARPDRVKTNRELTEELPTRGAPPELIGRVTPLFAWFDRAFYSLEAVPPADARRFLDDVRALTEQAS
ncbi:MAG: DUF4129 domain-containing protein [Archangium sp.]|nr:DUF4129 domain-containing protein [Archangium sp.]MDP3152434.1 DUF4129 domain-containing protein [Archangium sp.]MDP3572396.1 DUF4129 domain-containing protein [Archangium sp.]